MKMLHTSMSALKRFLTFSLVLLCLGIQAFAQSNNTQKFEYKQLFPRNQTYEYQVLKALDFNPNPGLANVNLNETVKSYAQLNDLEKAFGNLGLLAVELYAAQFNPNADPQTLLNSIKSRNMPNLKPTVTYIMGLLVMNVVSGKGGDAPTLALKGWATEMYRSIKVRTSKSVLNEYQKWKADPCSYKADGYTPTPDCGLKGLDVSQWYQGKKAPEDIIAKAGLKSVFANNADAVYNTLAISLTAVTATAAFVMLTSALGPGAIATSLYGILGGAAMGAGFAAVAAAPVAAAILIVVVGTIQGIKEVEAAKVEPMLKMKLGAAMTEHIEIANTLSDDNARTMFMWAFQEAAVKGFQLTEPKVDGEVRFYCQAGYVSKFKVSYTVSEPLSLNAKVVNVETSDLSVGNEEYVPLPYNAKNIRIRGLYAAAGWKDIFNLSLSQPTYICYTSYGTIFEPRYKNDCPEVGNMVAKKNELTLTHGGGYVARLKVTYVQNGKTITLIDNNGLTAGWRKVFSIPQGASDITVEGWSATGVVWEPWKQVLNRRWPNPPNECLKIYGTTLDPKWNNECN